MHTKVLYFSSCVVSLQRKIGHSGLVWGWKDGSPRYVQVSPGESHPAQPLSADVAVGNHSNCHSKEAQVLLTVTSLDFYQVQRGGVAGLGSHHHILYRCPWVESRGLRALAMSEHRTVERAPGASGYQTNGHLRHQLVPIQPLT